MNEALVLLLEGASMDDVDKAATRFGMPMGPIALQDMVGLDTSCAAGKVLIAAFRDRAVEIPLMEDLVAAGRLGQKSGAGFRKFGKKGRAEPDPAVQPFIEKHLTGKKSFTPQELQERLFLPMLLEATRILEEGIVREPGHVDMGMILGTGFPLFRGGILRWCDSQGADKVVQLAEKYAPLGMRFEPTESLKKMARTGGNFYPMPSLAKSK
jgi:3-hydroxyacyl-CoA dehydrogenase/enoyl-CoA hydratase/3-hydroxybutyryl-CoA epimerase/3-hydroxyacyl-CoA dehydrogenase/enoyl-CoA hydratase/3-hydroxybutyryl-CoA epimerase/enoyl-CoA isomerase